MRFFDWFSTTVFFSETLGRPQKCYSWIWHFLAFDDSWPSTKVGGLRRRRGKFCSRIIGPSLQHKWGKSLWKRKEAGEYRFLYYFSKVFSLFNKSRFDSTNWIKKKARGKNCVKRNSSLRLSIFELFLPWDDNFHLVFRYSPSLLLAFTAAAELTFHLWFWIKLSSLKSQQYCAVRENHQNCLIIIFFDFWLINLCQNTPRGLNKRSSLRSQFCKIRLFF